MAAGAKGGGGTWCAAPNCHNSRQKGWRLFSFPKDEERSKKWVENCKRSDLVGRPASYLHANCSLCSAHFEPSQFMDATRMNCRLIWCAVPTLFKFPSPPSALTKKRKLPATKEVPVSARQCKKKGEVQDNDNAVHKAAVCTAESMEAEKMQPDFPSQCDADTDRDLYSDRYFEPEIKLEPPDSELYDDTQDTEMGMSVTCISKTQSHSVSMADGHADSDLELDTHFEINLKTESQETGERVDNKTVGTSFTADRSANEMTDADSMMQVSQADKPQPVVLFKYDTNVDGDLYPSVNSERETNSEPWSDCGGQESEVELGVTGTSETLSKDATMADGHTDSDLEPDVHFEPKIKTEPQETGEYTEGETAVANFTADRSANEMADADQLSQNDKPQPVLPNKYGRNMDRDLYHGVYFEPGIKSEPQDPNHEFDHGGQESEVGIGVGGASELHSDTAATVGGYTDFDLEPDAHCELKFKSDPQETGEYAGGETAVINCYFTVDRSANNEITDANRVTQIGQVKKRHTCELCGMTFPNATRLKFHKFTHTGESPFICKECGESFTRPDVLKRHQRIHVGDRVFVCTECGAGFKDSDNLKTHMRIHTGEKPYSCDLCDMTFTYSSSLKSHRFTHTGQSPFVCKVCGAAFTRSVTLGRHMRTHTRERLVPCTDCGKAFRDLSTMRKHMRVHASDRPFACADCTSSFASSEELKAHTLVHMVEKPFRCDLCGTCFAHASGLRQHMRLHTGERPFVCAECGASFTQAGNLNQHKRVHVGDTLFPCEKCGVKYGQLSSLTRHMNTKHRNEKLFDQETEFSAQRDADLNMSDGLPQFSAPNTKSLLDCEGHNTDENTGQEHTDMLPNYDYIPKQDTSENSRIEEGDSELAHSTVQTPTLESLSTAEIKTESPELCYKLKDDGEDEAVDGDGDADVTVSEKVQCPVTPSTRNEDGHFLCMACGASFVGSQLFNSHVQSHSVEKAFKCKECGLSFTHSSNLKSHEATHSSDTPFTCAECGSTFTESDSLRIHMETHVTGRLFTCKDCGKTFRERAAFNLHRRTHTGDRPFPCGICGMTFTQQRSLASHKLTHTNDRIFPCTECEATFKDSSKLRDHMRVHSDEMPYSCRECGASFRESSKLKRHMNVHTSEKPFPCPECTSSFTCSQDLKRHMRKHTGEKPFRCDVCDTCFTHLSTLKQHTRIHTGERPFVCEDCGDTFTKSGNLNKHKLVHRGDRLFRCEECGVPFGQIGSLTRHVNTKHRGEKVTDQGPVSQDGASASERSVSIKVEKQASVMASTP